MPEIVWRYDMDAAPVGPLLLLSVRWPTGSRTETSGGYRSHPNLVDSGIAAWESDVGDPFIPHAVYAWAEWPQPGTGTSEGDKTVADWAALAQSDKAFAAGVKSASDHIEAQLVSWSGTGIGPEYMIAHLLDGLAALPQHAGMILQRRAVENAERERWRKIEHAAKALSRAMFLAVEENRLRYDEAVGKLWDALSNALAAEVPR
jgi:hypothetical protein